MWFSLEVGGGDFDGSLQFDSLGVRDGQDNRTSGWRTLPFPCLSSELNEESADGGPVASLSQRKGYIGRCH